MVEYGRDCSGSGRGAVEGTCEHSSELSGSIKWLTLSTVAEQLAIFQEELSSLELAS
jgi:hypothetical protein